MRLCFFGDSFVAGVGDPDHLGWPGRVCASAHARVGAVTHYNLGIRRDTSADVALRWRLEAERRLPDGEDGRLVFSFGANDCALENGHARVALASSLAHLAAVLDSARRWRPTLMVGPPPVAEENLRNSNERIRARSEAFGRACGLLGVPYLDLFGLLRGSDLWRAEVAAGDGAHPGASGYALISEAVESWSGWRAWFP